MKIIVSGQATAKNAQSDEEIRDANTLKSLNGQRYDRDLLTNYLDKDAINQVSIIGGAIALAYDEAKNELRVVSEFWAPRELSSEEIEELIDATRGQWSDGIGAACFDDLAEQHGVSLDLAPRSQYKPGGVVVQQVEDGVAVPRFAHLPKAYWKSGGDIVRQAVEEKAALNAVYDTYTTLRMTLQKKDMPTAIMLIEAGADVNISNPLYACMSLPDEADAAKIARLLIAHGADVNARDASGKTPLQAARKQQRSALIDLLLAAGAKDGQ